MHDTTTWQDGRVENRDGTARLSGTRAHPVTCDDMPGGTALRLPAGGFSFSPHQMLIVAPPLPLPILVHARDDCRWDATTDN